MIERLFPRALLACIGENRPPLPQELTALAEKVLREAFPRNHGRSARQRALRIAHAAFVGTLARVS